MPKIPQALYSCACCREDYSWPAQDIHLSHGKEWICGMCWDHSAHGERGISLADAIENERDKTIAELQDTERQIRITVQAGDRPLADEVSDRIHKMFALQMEVADLTRKLEAEIKERQEYAGRLQGVINERDDALAKLEEMERAHVNPRDSVKRERDAALAELAAAKREGAEDKARLDWLEEGFNRISCTLSNRHGVTRNALTWVETTPESLQSFREAIDAARRAE